MLMRPAAAAGMALVVGVGLGASNRRPEWIGGDADARFARVEKHLRGFDVAMTEIGYRYTEPYFAVTDRNWDYADYQLGKIQLVLELAVERRPKRARSAGAFLEDDLPAVHAGIKSREPEAASAAMDRLRTACMKCHVSEEVPYFTLREPDRRLAPIRQD